MDWLKGVVDDVGVLNTLQHLLNLLVGSNIKRGSSDGYKAFIRILAAGDSWDHGGIHISGEDAVLHDVDIRQRLDSIGDTLGVSG